MDILQLIGLKALAGGNSGGGGSTEEWFNDGNTHIWISLAEGRTSPMLGVCPKGTVTVDWGDGTTPDVLTGTSTSVVKWTPTHNYAKAGDYVIRLTVDGSMGLMGESSVSTGAGILRHSSTSDNINYTYRNAVRSVEVGDSVTSIGMYAFQYCYALTSIAISDSVTSIADSAFQNCYSLASVTIPDSVTSIGMYAFRGCGGLASVAIPDSVTSIGMYAFQNCYALTSIAIPDSVTSIGEYAFQGCYSLASVTIPDSVTSIGNGAFQGCYSLASVTIPDSVTSISAYMFRSCYSIRFYDFTNHTVVPTLAATSAFTDISADCEIRVPADLMLEWLADTNWSNYGNNMRGV